MQEDYVNFIVQHCIFYEKELSNPESYLIDGGESSKFTYEINQDILEIILRSLLSLYGRRNVNLSGFVCLALQIITIIIRPAPSIQGLDTNTKMAPIVVGFISACVRSLKFLYQ